MSVATPNTEVVPKITLHWLEVSRAHRILWLLEELKVPYELKTWKRNSEKMADPKLKEVHPLGKSPILEIEVPGEKLLILIESATIVEYICDYYGKHLIPQGYPAGRDGKIGQETEQWLRYRKYMHYAEGSIMPFMVFSLVVEGIENAPLPFFLKPITRTVGAKVRQAFLSPNYKTHFEWLESELASSPNGGQYFCGDFTAADIMMSFPMQAGLTRTGMTKQQVPLIYAYVDRLEQRESWKVSVEKIKKIEGEFVTNLYFNVVFGQQMLKLGIIQAMMFVYAGCNGSRINC